MSIDLRNTIWKIHVPFAEQFAQLLSLYVPPPPGTIRCQLCRSAPLPPLQVEWDDGSDTISDFTAAGARIVVREGIARDLREAFRGVSLREILMPDHPKLRRPLRVTARTVRRVWLPYQGPALSELHVEAVVPLAVQSTVTTERTCSGCGSIVYSAFEGIEERTSRHHLPRVAGKGLFIRRSDLHGNDIFKPAFTGLTLCTLNVKQFIEARGYSNVVFLEAGTLIP